MRLGTVDADIGANLGHFSLLIAELVSAKRHIHAFEYNSHIARLLRQSLNLNYPSDRHTVHLAASAAAEGEAMAFIVPPSQFKNARLVAFAGKILENARIRQTRLVDSDAVWSRIEFAKIDVGRAQELLDSRRLKTVLFEFTPDRFGKRGAFLDQLFAPGFSYAWIDPWTGIKPISREALLARKGSEHMTLALRG